MTDKADTTPWRVLVVWGDEYHFGSGSRRDPKVRLLRRLNEGREEIAWETSDGADVLGSPRWTSVETIVAKNLYPVFASLERQFVKGALGILEAASKLGMPEDPLWNP